MSSPISGKAYYECPAQQFVAFPPSGLAWRPLLAPLVDDPVTGTPGVWAICYQDSDTAPTAFVVAVSDRQSARAPRNPAVHDGIAAGVAGAYFHGPNFAMAQASVAARRGAVAASQMVDQTVGGE